MLVWNQAVSIRSRDRGGAWVVKPNERESMLNNGWLTRTIDVAELLAAGRKKKTAEEKVMTEKDKMSTEEWREIVRREALKMGMLQEDNES